MNKVYNILGGSLIFLLISFNQRCSQPMALDMEEEAYELVWADEFDYEGLPDSTKWSYDVGDACEKPCGCGWGNHELQYYTEKDLDNARVSDGKLTIEVHEEEMKNNKFTSARLVTKNKGDWKYGRIETRAKVAEGKGVWSAIWMLSTEDKHKGWPHSGEIDIMENVGYDPDTIVGSAHTANFYHSIGTHKSGRIFTPTANQDFHNYTLEWEPTEYRLYVDNELYFIFENDGTGFKSWPFDENFHLILNVAYGGDWGGREGVDIAALPARMDVDYVRVYQKNRKL